LLPGETTVVAWDGDTPILVCNHDGAFYALRTAARTRTSSSAGAFDGGDATIECVLHGAKFDVRDGRCCRHPPTRRW
jgi:3-phenylpropionate/trans-cinnamate dioxygenase ferredoxin subunit